MGITCTDCQKAFNRPQALQRHYATESHQRKRRLPQSSTNAVVKKVRITQPGQSPEFGIRLIHRGMSDLFKIYRAQLKRVWNDISLLATVLAAHIIYLINRAVMDTNGVKVQMRCTVEFYKQNDTEQKRLAFFASSQSICLQSTDASQQYALAMAQIHRQIEEFVNSGSNWVIGKIQNMDLYVSKYSPIRGLTYKKLPKELESKKAIVNVKNDDDHCFMWSVLAKLRHDEAGSLRNADRISHYRGMENRLNMNNIQNPVSLEDIPLFEQQNDLAINVFGYGEGLYPLYITKDRSKNPINLLLLTPDDAPAHYCWIKNLDKLLFRSTKHKGRKFICPYCLCPFNSERRLIKHQEFCTANKQRIELPEDPVLKFRNFHRQIRSPYLIYADFECFLKKDGEKSLHVPNSYGVMGVRQCCGDAKYEEPNIYRGDDPVKKFLDEVIRKGEQFQSEPMEPINMSATDYETFSTTKTCHTCKDALKDQPVRDHCHQCGKFRGAAHNTCNTKLYEKKDVTVVFHNLRKYDGHLIMKEIGRVAKDRGMKLNCVAKSAEDYITFSIGLQTNGKRWKLRFVDSLAFLNASLDTLAQSIPPDQFTALRKFTKRPDLLSKKGIYPYEFVDNKEKFLSSSLPPPGAFYSSLKLEGITDDDYEHAQKVWTAHNLANFGEYHDLYLTTDVLLLADIFQNFRDFAVKNFEIDPAHYVTLPSFAWDALLKYTGAKLELLQDPDMYQFFTAGIRGGVSVISHRYAKARHTGVPDFNPYEPQNWTTSIIPYEWIVYLDANNLYGWAMQQHLPVSNFEWVGEQDQLPEDEEGVGYVWEVDLKYPREIHDQHNDYPMAPEHMIVNDLSPYCKRLKEKLKIPDVPCEKLVPNLHDKKNYIVHHQNLKLYLKHGLEITKIHRGIKFKEDNWMAPYIAFNTEMRKMATTQFQKDLFKLLNNAVFGKSMENVFSYLDVRLVTDPKKYEKLVASPLYKESQPFDNDLTAVLMNKEKAVLNKPIFTGFAVLELSKTLMYKFHYEYMWPKYHYYAQLLFTDTDSLCYKVMTDDIYEDMLQDRDQWFDTSDYPSNHPLFSVTNKKKIGMMKDETKGDPILEFVGLRAKMYSFQTDKDTHIRAKGVTRAVVKHCITHADYRRTLKEEDCLRHKMQGFRSNAHQIQTVEFEKSTLSAFDDKRYILNDGISTLAYGHYRIQEQAQ